MKTKIVYVLVSSDNDIYFEQLLVSVYSLKYYNPDAFVVVLVDNNTFETLNGYRKVLYEYINEIKVIDTPQNYSPKERSREIKTSIRKHINGDFLYLDTDTIICDNIKEVDDIKNNISIVLDFHVPFREYPFRKYIIEIIDNIFNIDVNNVEDYYNSGIMLIKDTKIAYDFFNAWNKNWRYSAFHKNNSQDQPALMKTNYDFKNVVRNLDGIYNCQIAASIKYLHNGKILHFFNSTFFNDTKYTPFFTKDFYLNIRNNRGFTDDYKNCILNCKSSFEPFTTPIGHDEFIFLTSLFGKRIFKQFIKKGFIYNLFNIILKVINRINSFI